MCVCVHTCACTCVRPHVCMHALCVCGHLCACGWMCYNLHGECMLICVVCMHFPLHYKAFTSNELSFVAWWQPFVRLWTCLAQEDGPAACLKHHVCSVGKVPVTDGFQESFLAC